MVDKMVQMGIVLRCSELYICKKAKTNERESVARLI